MRTHVGLLMKNNTSYYVDAAQSQLIVEYNECRVFLPAWVIVLCLHHRPSSVLVT